MTEIQKSNSKYWRQWFRWSSQLWHNGLRRLFAVSYEVIYTSALKPSNSVSVSKGREHLLTRDLFRMPRVARIIAGRKCAFIHWLIEKLVCLSQGVRWQVRSHSYVRLMNRQECGPVMTCQNWFLPAAWRDSMFCVLIWVIQGLFQNYLYA